MVGVSTAIVAVTAGKGPMVPGGRCLYSDRCCDDVTRADGTRWSVSPQRSLLGRRVKGRWYSVVGVSTAIVAGMANQGPMVHGGRCVYSDRCWDDEPRADGTRWSVSLQRSLLGRRVKGRWYTVVGVSTAIVAGTTSQGPMVHGGRCL